MNLNTSAAETYVTFHVSASAQNHQMRKLAASLARYSASHKGHGIMYTRKTRDEWQLLVNYGHGWKHELSEDTFKEISARVDEYRARFPQYPVRRRKRRVINK